MSVIKGFLRFTEIRTKVTCVFSFVLVLSLLFYMGAPVRPLLCALFFASMLLFDITTTALNNYRDSKIDDTQLPFARKTAKILIYVLFFSATVSGLALAALTDGTVLILGALCFLCGLCYSAGPLPLYRLPVGELFSGLFYGYVLTFIVFYINLPPKSVLWFEYADGLLRINVNAARVLPFAAVCAAPFCATAAVMLANNVCDREKDVAVGRYTLAHYIKDKAFPLFGLLYAVPYVCGGILIAAGFLPPLYFLSFLTAPVIFRNVAAFRRTPNKIEGFPLAIRNFILLIGGNILFLVVCALQSR